MFVIGDIKQPTAGVLVSHTDGLFPLTVLIAPDALDVLAPLDSPDVLSPSG